MKIYIMKTCVRCHGADFKRVPKGNLVPFKNGDKIEYPIKYKCSRCGW